MLLIGDESKKYPKKVYGIICSDKDNFLEFEKAVASLRYDKTLWGEIDWKSLPSKDNRLFLAYIEFLNIFLSLKMNFYSIVYTIPNYPRLLSKGFTKEYIDDLRNTLDARMIFCLIRHISEKLYEAKLTDELKIIGDESTELNKQWVVINEYLSNKSQRVKHQIESCTFGKSNICSLIQLSDILTGLVANKANGRLTENQQELLNHIEKSLTTEIGLDEPVSWSRWGNRRINTWHFKPNSLIY